MLVLPGDVWEKILEDCLHRYPIEALGVLIGKRSEMGKEVEEVRPIRNTLKSEDWCAYYEEDLRSVYREGKTVIGFYHSHDIATASEKDKNFCYFWPEHSFLIIVPEFGDYKSYVYKGEREEIEEEKVTIV